MPKEVIYDPYMNDGGVRTEIRWSRDGFIQLATVADEAPGPSGLGAEGWFVHLDRKAVNELIRYLRRARDQAFGRDE